MLHFVPYVLPLLVIVFAGLIVRAQFATLTIHEYERGLKLVRGTLRSELTAGRYWYLRSLTSVRVFDLRQAQMTVNNQEVLSRDGVAVKASLTATYRVETPRTALMAATDFTATLYAELQQALRTVVSTSDIESLLQSRSELGSTLLTHVKPAGERLGLVLEHVALRDLTFPGELKKLFTQVVKAKQEGLATLERARGETAALRNLANAASMVERNPSLLQLRSLQVASQQPGTTLVLGIPGGTPFPVRPAGSDDAPGSPTNSDPLS